MVTSVIFYVAFAHSAHALVLPRIDSVVRAAVPINGVAALAIVAGVAFVALAAFGALAYNRRITPTLVPEAWLHDSGDTEEELPDVDDKVEIFLDGEESKQRQRRGDGTYRRGDMVAARRVGTPGFCVASIVRVHRDDEMHINALSVRWYRAYGAKFADPFASSYSPAWLENRPWEERISINSVFVRFDTLNRDNCIPTEVCGALGDPTAV